MLPHTPPHHYSGRATHPPSVIQMQINVGALVAVDALYYLTRRIKVWAQFFIFVLAGEQTEI